MAAIYLISNFLLNISCIIFCANLSHKNVNWRKKQAWLPVGIMTIIGLIQDTYNPRLLKLFISVIVLFIIIYIFIERKVHKSIILLILLDISIIISEVLFLGTISTFSIDYQTKSCLIACNIFVSAMLIATSNTKFTKNIYKFITNMVEKIGKKEIWMYSTMIITMLIISTAESYLKLPILLMLITNTVISFIFIAVIIKFVNTKNQYKNINKKYQTSVKSLKEYEMMIDKFRVNNHENKNELLTIRNMVKNKDKKTINYIDTLVDNKIKDNEKIMFQTSKIPEGGLRATIYSKLCVMEKNKIGYKLDIAKDVRTVDLINLDEELVLNICKILGVLLDNAIDAVKTLREKSICIELYVVDNSLYIDITNNFSGNLDLNKMGRERSTTKGKEHGYGLLLVNKIINENSKYLENEKRVDGNLFTQSLKIKM